jgi:transposase-like protein
MAQLSYRRHRFPAEIIQHAIWLYLRFTLSYRDVEELLAERGLEVSYETVRRWVLKFGPLIARKLRQGRPRPSARWHLDEMVVGSPGSRCTCGAPSTTRARSSICSSSVGGIRRRQSG